MSLPAPALPHISCRAAVSVDQGGDGRMAAQLVQTAAAGGPDAPHRDAKPGTDLGVRNRRVLDQQQDQLLVARRQVPERLAQRGVPLGRQQLLLSRSSGMVSASTT